MNDGTVTGHASLLSRLTVVLVRPREASNVGSVARLMSNFGVRNAVLVAPRCDSSSVDARHNATGSGAVTLATMRVVKSIQELSSDNQIFVAVTTSAPEASAQTLSMSDVVTKLQSESVSLVFGPEETGLSDADLNRCSYVFRIPVAASSGNLNLSHSVAVVLSRIFSETL